LVELLCVRPGAAICARLAGQRTPLRTNCIDVYRYLPIGLFCIHSIEDEELTVWRLSRTPVVFSTGQPSYARLLRIRRNGKERRRQFTDPGRKRSPRAGSEGVRREGGDSQCPGMRLEPR